MTGLRSGTYVVQLGRFMLAIFKVFMPDVSYLGPFLTAMTFDRIRVVALHD